MKTVLITGANKGIGFDTAKQLAQLGYFVFIGSRDKKNGLAAVEKLKAAGLNNVDTLEIDITNAHSVQAARKELENKIQSLDVLINNAGIAGDQPQDIATGSIDNLRKVFDTNFFGAVQATQAFIDMLKRSDTPCIVNVSSRLASLAIQSQSDNPNLRIYDAYSSSKTALNAFTVLLARQFGNTNFKINCVEPGYTATDLNGFKGAQTPEQAAKMIVKYATIGNDGPTGKYFGREGELPW